MAQILYSASEDRFWDAHKKLDILLTEEEFGDDSFILIRSAEDIARTLCSDAVGIIAKISGGRPLQGKENLNILANLRSLYRSGLRSVQLTGNGRNRLGDGVAQECSRGRLTNFGKAVVQESDRLGMVIDSSQLSDYGFFDLAELTDSPIIDSHTGARAVCDHLRTISDERIRTIARTGGVIGVSFLSAIVAGEKEHPDTDDLLRQIDHIAGVAGIDHVALGPDYCAYQTPVNRSVIRAMRTEVPASVSSTGSPPCRARNTLDTSRESITGSERVIISQVLTTTNDSGRSFRCCRPMAMHKRISLRSLVRTHFACIPKYYDKQGALYVIDS